MKWRDIIKYKPPESEFVLLFCADGFFSDATTMEIGTYDQWHGTATHWMPLPEPPDHARTRESLKKEDL